MDGGNPSGDANLIHSPVKRRLLGLPMISKSRVRPPKLTLEQMMKMDWRTRVANGIKPPPNEYPYRWKNGVMTPEEKEFRRCHWKSNKNPDGRCRRKADNMSLFCYFHNRKFVVRKRNRIWRLYTKMPGLYTKHMGPALMEIVEQATKQPIADQVSLYEELAIARGLVAKALDMDAKVERSKGTDKPASPSTEAAVHEALREAIKDVSDICEKIAKIERGAEGQVSVTQLAYFVANMTKLIFEVLGTEHADLAEKLADHIKRNLRMPTDPVVIGAASEVIIPAPIHGLPEGVPESIEIPHT